MMTMRRIGEDGRESVVSVISVDYDQDTNVLVGHVGEPVVYDTGLVYVMNDNGKTVVVYNLTKQKQVK